MAPPRLSLSKLKGFPNELHPSGKILTLSFINASYEVIEIIDNFGRLFYPVVTDMRGNTDRLFEHYKRDEKSRQFIEDMVLNDEHQVTHSWLLWLKRALEMMDRFFWLLLNNEDVISEKSDNVKPMISQAYNEVLKPYHGWISQNAFRLINSCVPSRSTLFGSGFQFCENVKSLQELQPRMRLHIDKISSLYRENDLDSNEKV